MQEKKSVALLAVCGVTILGLTACSLLLPSLPGSRTNNQGGGTVASGYSKVTGGRLTALTPDEIQLLTDYAISQGLVENLEALTDDQAAAILQFLKDNNINSIEDFENLDPNNIVISDEVREAIEAMFGVNLDQQL